MDFLNADFFRSLVTTFVGALLAIGTAVGGWWLSGRRRRKAAAVRRGQLAYALAQSLEHDLEIAKAASELPEDKILTVNVDLSLIEATRSLKYDVFGDIDLSRDIDEVGYQLASLRRLLELRLEMEYSGSVLAFTGLNQMRKGLNDLIRERAKKAQEYESGKQVARRLKEMAKSGSQTRESGSGS